MIVTLISMSPFLNQKVSKTSVHVVLLTLDVELTTQLVQ